MTYHIKYPCRHHILTHFEIDCLQCNAMPVFALTDDKLTGVAPSRYSVPSEDTATWARELQADLEKGIVRKVGT